jgi:hypothetical protein
MKKADLIESMNFLKPIHVNGRTIEGLGSDYLAQTVAFPWIAVWARNAPEKVRLTTVFNVADSAPVPSAFAEEPKRKAKGDAPAE